MHDSAVASVSPRRAAAGRARAPATERSSRANRYRSSGLAQPRARARRRAASAPGSTTRSTWISKSRAQIVASTPSPSPPASSSARATADSLDAEEAEHAPRRRGRARGAAAANGAVSSARGQSRCSSPRRPGQRRPRRGRPCSSTSAGAVPASPTTTAPSGSVRLLADARARSRRRGVASRSAIARETRSISSAERLVDARGASPAPARAARPCGRRGSARGRRRRRAGRARAPRRVRRSSSSGRSPTIAIRAGSSPSESSSRARNGPFRSVRSPRTSSLPVTTTTRPAASLEAHGFGACAGMLLTKRIATGRAQPVAVATGKLDAAEPRRVRCANRGCPRARIEPLTARRPPTVAVTRITWASTPARGRGGRARGSRRSRGCRATPRASCCRGSRPVVARGDRAVEGEVAVDGATAVGDHVRRADRRPQLEERRHDPRRRRGVRPARDRRRATALAATPSRPRSRPP